MSEDKDERPFGAAVNENVISNSVDDEETLTRADRALSRKVDRKFVEGRHISVHAFRISEDALFPSLLPVLTLLYLLSFLDR